MPTKKPPVPPGQSAPVTPAEEERAAATPERRSLRSYFTTKWRAEVEREFRRQLPRYQNRPFSQHPLVIMSMTLDVLRHAFARLENKKIVPYRLTRALIDKIHPGGPLIEGKPVPMVPIADMVSLALKYRDVGLSMKDIGATAAGEDVRYHPQAYTIVEELTPKTLAFEEAKQHKLRRAYKEVDKKAREIFPLRVQVEPHRASEFRERAKKYAEQAKIMLEILEQNQAKLDSYQGQPTAPPIPAPQLQPTVAVLPPQRPPPSPPPAPPPPTPSGPMQLTTMCPKPGEATPWSRAGARAYRSREDIPQDEAENLRRIWERAKATNTRRGYKADWTHWTRWCAAHDIQPLPAHPYAVADYISQQAKDPVAGLKPSTIQRRLAAINAYHIENHCASPTRAPEVLRAMQGIRNTLGTKQEGKDAITLDILKKLVRSIPAEGYGLRNRALLLIGFFAALRRSELTALTVEDIEWRDDHMIVHIRSSKTDQAGQGQQVAIDNWYKEPDMCPLTALRAWLRASNIQTGYIFRGQELNDPSKMRNKPLKHSMVSHIIKQLIRNLPEDQREGLNPDDFGAHSLRSGFVTEAFKRGCTVPEIQAVTRHISANVLIKYFKAANILRDSAACKIHD